VRIFLEEEGLRCSIRFGDVEWEVEVLGTYWHSLPSTSPPSGDWAWSSAEVK
jgi:hypothetical protein